MEILTKEVSKLIESYQISINDKYIYSFQQMDVLIVYLELLEEEVRMAYLLVILIAYDLRPMPYDL